MAVSIALCSGSCLSGETLGDGWQWRRPLVFKQVLSDAPGENIAWAEFYANGTQQSNGTDIRVTTADRQVMPQKLMEVSRDSDLVRVAFATKSDGPYFVWWGNPKAEKPGEKELEIKRGVYLEVLRNDLRPAAALNQAGASGTVLASYFVPELSLGYDPYGEERNVVLRYSAQFRLDRALKPSMAFTTTEMGAMWIDGKEVGRERGGMRGRVRDPFAVDLAAGWHTAEVKQLVQNPGNVGMAAVWERPGETNYTTLPETVFAPVAHALVGAMEKIGAGFVPDITVDPTAEGFIPPSNYVSRYTFEAQYPASMRPRIVWDFGDGQAATGLKKVSHVYLTPGTYAVTLKLDLNGGGAGGGNEGEAAGLATTVRIPVKGRMFAKFPRPPEDPPKTLAAVLHDYEPGTLPGAQAFEGMVFFESVADVEDQIKWGQAWLEAKEGPTAPQPPEQDVLAETTTLARLLDAHRRDKEAADVYRLASLKPLGMEMRLNLMRHEVMILCDYLDDATGALAEAQGWEKRVSVGNRGEVAMLQTAIAYAAVAKGDGKLAKAAVDAAVAARGAGVGRGAGGFAGGAGTGMDGAFNQMEIRQGVLARNIENYIRTKDFDTAWDLVDQWEAEFPNAIWEGFTRTLRVKLAAAQGRNLVAARIALEHAKANPEGFYAAELLYRAAENFKLGGEQANAKTVMELLAGKYPESPYARSGEVAR